MRHLSRRDLSFVLCHRHAICSISHLTEQPRNSNPGRFLFSLDPRRLSHKVGKAGGDIAHWNLTESLNQKGQYFVS